MIVGKDYFVEIKGSEFKDGYDVRFMFFVIGLKRRVLQNIVGLVVVNVCLVFDESFNSILKSFIVFLISLLNLMKRVRSNYGEFI